MFMLKTQEYKRKASKMNNTKLKDFQDHQTIHNIKNKIKKVRLNIPIKYFCLTSISNLQDQTWKKSNY